MTTNHIKAILTSLRAMVVKMLPAYKFYLGSTTETTTTQIGHGVMSVEDGQTQGQGALTLDDASFSGFVEGETYTAIVNGVSGEYVAVQTDSVLITNIQDFGNFPENYWAVSFVSPGTGKPYILVYMASGSYANATISISQTKTVTTKNYQTKKLDKSLLPDSVESGIKAANTKATDALSAANAAQSTANAAQSTANAKFQLMRQTTVKATKTIGAVNNSVGSVLVKRLNIAVGSTIKFTADGNFSGMAVWDSAYKRIDILNNVGAPVSRLLLELLQDGDTYRFTNEKYATILSNLVIEYEKVIIPKDVNTTRGEGAWLPPYLIANCLYLTKALTVPGQATLYRITVDDNGTLTATEVTDA